ncbi:MAG: DUF535 family protein [Sphingobacteriales bacterium]|nr:DUF535 family protein [Sphingobacteriales bacterium]OJY91351.1 MAG: hypothetical protein BGP14_16155 [Sphingobacteriales bacterium 44-15]
MLPACIKGWRLAADAFSGERKGYRRKQQYKIFLYTFLNPLFARRWFNTLYLPEHNKVVIHRPRLYVKPFRVYMSSRWDKHRKMKVILDTYHFIDTAGKAFAQIITEKGGLPLACFRLKDNTPASVVLGYDERYRKEGELVLFFVCEQLGGVVAAASFSFEQSAANKWICRVGCVQGNKPGDENVAKTAQHLMHGLRPKSFMIFLVQEFARQLGMEAIYGAGQSIQAFRRKHLIHIPILHTINQNYNDMWLESGGTSEKDGWFALPLVPKRKALNEIKSHKRAIYRRRYEMMDAVSAEIFKSMQHMDCCYDLAEH